jgi:hypothetical protein
MVRGVSVLIAPARPAFLLLYGFDFGPDFSLPFILRARSISSVDQFRKALRPTLSCFGGFSFPFASQRSRVALETPIDLATSDVDCGLIMRLKGVTIQKRLSSYLFRWAATAGGYLTD